MDYLDQLTDEELKWLNNFMEEYNGASFKRNKTRDSWDKEYIHNTDELKKDCQRRNNARNRCLYTILKVNNLLDNMVEKYDKEINNNTEETLIDLLDYSNETNIDTD